MNDLLQDPEMRALLALHLVPGIGPKLTEAMINRFGSARAIHEAKPEELREIPYLGEKLSRDVRAALARADLGAELALLEKHSCRLLVRGQEGYPPPIVEIPTAPYLLYHCGSWLPQDRKAVALVGSRSCTPYGKRVADRLATDLVRAGYTVISGLARGIDGVAHKAALKAGGRTIAVLAGGLSRIYPPEHADLAQEVSRSGALISEASMAMEPMAGMFPARNRLISGLSLGVVIIEAAEKSGALITATHAAEQGRPVFAVPGPIDSDASRGSHGLIRKGAILIRGIEDILEELKDQPGFLPEPAAQEPPPGLDATQMRVWQFLAERPRHMDEMAQELGLSVAELAGALMRMELKRCVRRLPGNQFERV